MVYCWGFLFLVKPRSSLSLSICQITPRIRKDQPLIRSDFQHLLSSRLFFQDFADYELANLSFKVEEIRLTFPIQYILTSFHALQAFFYQFIQRRINQIGFSTAFNRFFFVNLTSNSARNFAEIRSNYTLTKIFCHNSIPWRISCKF